MEPYNVLMDHHRKNQAPKAPNPSHLKQVKSKQPKCEPATPSVSYSDSNKNSEAKSNSKQCTPRHLKPGTAAWPTQLRFYPPLWSNVLKCSKMFWWHHLTLFDVFSVWTESKDALGDCLTQTIAEHEKDGGVLEEGTILVFH